MGTRKKRVERNGLMEIRKSEGKRGARGARIERTMKEKGVQREEGRGGGRGKVKWSSGGRRIWQTDQEGGERG